MPPRSVYLPEEYFSLNCVGLMPVMRLNIREKCCGYWNPNS